jgi:hypothetical protein
MDIVIGEGLKDESKFTGTWPREAELTDEMKSMSFQEIGEQLAKQFGVENGIIKLIEINFVVKTN